MTPVLTDQQLIKALRKSRIEEAEKKKIEYFIPQMDSQEREELMALIKESHEVHNKIQAFQQEQMAAINSDFKAQLKKVNSNFRKKAAAEYEEINQKAEEDQMKKIEQEIGQA